MTMLDAIFQRSLSKHTATVVFLHGLGDSGAGWASVGSMFAKYLPHVKFIFPHAPSMPVSINGGYVMPAWYDIKGSLDRMDSLAVDQGDFDRSNQQIMTLIDNEVESGIPTERIVLGGFSQGGAITLYSLLSSQRRLAAAVVLSSYLPMHKNASAWSREENKATPVFMAHGTADPVIPFSQGEKSASELKRLGMSQLEFHRIPNMPHSANDEELSMVLSFLQRVIPEEEK